MPNAFVVGNLSETEMDELRELRANVDVANRAAVDAQAVLVQEQTLLQAFLIRLQRRRGLRDGDEVAPDGRILRPGPFGNGGELLEDPRKLSGGGAG